MNQRAYQRITEMALQPDCMERSIAYLERHFRCFLKRREKVLICFPNTPGTIGPLMEQAVLRCEGQPFFLGEDQRWKTLLKTAFLSKCHAIVGPPLMILGLAKVARHMGTPLFARNVLVAGYPSTQWMVNGIQQGLDCKVWGCYDPGGDAALVCGFSCGCSGGVHLRSEEYSIRILDDQGREVPHGEMGRVILSPNGEPGLQFDTGDVGCLELQPCECGSTEPRLVAIDTGSGLDEGLSRLGESLHRWSSILDCHLANTGYGLEVEMVVFPGEKLPKLPTCAKLQVRPWDPEADAPFAHLYVLKNRSFPDIDG